MTHNSSVYMTSPIEGAPLWNLTAGCLTVACLDFHSQTRTRYRWWRVLQRCLGMHRAVYSGISLYIELKFWLFRCSFALSPRHRESVLQTFKFNPIVILSLQIERSSFISQAGAPLKFSLVQSICV